MIGAEDELADVTRRELLARGSAGIAWLAALGIPETVWALQDGEELVTFTDYTADFKIDAQAANPTVRCFDLRTLTTWATPERSALHLSSNDQTQRVDPATFRLRIGGFVERPRELTLDQLKARPDRRDVPVTLECSGNSTRPQRMSGLLSNGVWTGVGLASLLKEVGLKPEAREIVFLGLDMETEKKAAGRRSRVRDAARPQHVRAGRTQPRSDAGIFALNGQPLPAEQGFPLRLILPGWYGMTQIKWLGRIQVLDRRYEGQHMARNYLAMRSFDTPDGPLWLDTSISKTNMKSVVARVARRQAGERVGISNHRTRMGRPSADSARGCSD